MEGKKFDNGKTRWDLFPWQSAEKIVEVLEFGAKKYCENGWQAVPEAERRYFAAAIRHLTAWHRGEKTDTESGLSHLSHAACCLMFLLHFEENNNEESNNSNLDMVGIDEPNPAA